MGKGSPHTGPYILRKGGKVGAGVADRLALGPARPWERVVVTPAELPQSPNSYLDTGSVFVRRGLRGHNASIAGGHVWHGQGYV